MNVIKLSGQKSNVFIGYKLYVSSARGRNSLFRKSEFYLKHLICLYFISSKSKFLNRLKTVPVLQHILLDLNWSDLEGSFYPINTFFPPSLASEAPKSPNPEIVPSTCN